ncbi:MAG TPA: hypothetical protein DDY28_14860, partial [Hyphomonas atlantica]|nr:hypothetical protein [Hyphomonas atlantica]
GAVMAGLIEAVPQITWLGKKKGLVFSIAAGMIAMAGAWQWHARSLPCPVDPAQARACTRARRISWIVWWISVGAFVIGAFFAFFAAGLLA